MVVMRCVCADVICEDMRRDAMWLCDVVNWEMMCCELRSAPVTANLLRRPFHLATSISVRGASLGCKTQ